MKKLFVIVSSLAILATFSANKAEAFWNPFKWLFNAVKNSQPSEINNEFYDSLQNGRAAAARLISAYEARRVMPFMDHVSEQYTDDKDMLESDIRDDFSTYSNISINYVVNNVVPDSKGKLFVSINYNRKAIPIRTGKTFSDRGIAELIFIKEDGKYKLYSMRRPYLFGISDN
jgi:hypothetical protein